MTDVPAPAAEARDRLLPNQFRRHERLGRAGDDRGQHRGLIRRAGRPVAEHRQDPLATLKGNSSSPPRIVDTGWRVNSKRDTIPKLPPPPRSPHNRSVRSRSLACKTSPSAVTTLPLPGQEAPHLLRSPARPGARPRRPVQDRRAPPLRPRPLEVSLSPRLCSAQQAPSRHSTGSSSRRTRCRWATGRRARSSRSRLPDPTRKSSWSRCNGSARRRRQLAHASVGDTASMSSSPLLSGAVICVHDDPLSCMITDVNWRLW